MSKKTIIRVGYALNAKKLRKSSNADESNPTKKEWHGGGLADILDNNWMNENPDEVIEFIKWDHHLPITDQPNFDILIHKLTEDIDNFYSTDKCFHHKSQNNKDSFMDSNIQSSKVYALQNLLKNRPNLVIIDSIESVWKVTSRARTCETLNTIIQSPSCSFRQPNFTIFPLVSKEEDNNTIIKKLNTHDISFPIICKPVQACGTSVSHLMVVIVSPRDIHLLHKYRPCVVQQYHNHQGNFFKVYVIGNEVMTFRRKSLPDLDINDLNLRSVEFDSRNSYPTIQDFNCYNNNNNNVNGVYSFLPNKSSSDSWKLSSTVKSNKSNNNNVTSDYSENKGTEEFIDKALDSETFKTAADLISRSFGLSLFGFDVIIPTNSTGNISNNYSSVNEKICDPMTNQQLVVIDVNYFPSYKEVKDFPLKLKNFLREKSLVNVL